MLLDSEDSKLDGRKKWRRGAVACLLFFHPMVLGSNPGWQKDVSGQICLMAAVKFETAQSLWSRLQMLVMSVPNVLASKGK